MRKVALLLAVVGVWAVFMARSRPQPRRWSVDQRRSVEAYARSLTEPAGQMVEGRPALILKRPYPAPEQMEQAMGKADEKYSGYTWSHKYVWRTREGETVAWFNQADGLLEALELNYGGLEAIARGAMDYHVVKARLQ